MIFWYLISSLSYSEEYTGVTIYWFVTEIRLGGQYTLYEQYTIVQISIRKLDTNAILW